MSSYLDVLTADRERMRRALKGQIEAEAGAVRDLQAELERQTAELDQKIVRLMIFRSLFGASQQETLAAQVEVEETAKPHATATQQLAYHQRVLQSLQEALIRLEQTGNIEGTVSTPAADAAKITVADILGE
jgi:hypothetical protein